MQVHENNPLALNLFGETGSIPSTPFFSSDPNGDRLYAVWGDVIVTSPGSSGEVVVSVSYSNGTGAAGSSSLNGPAISLRTLGEQGFLLGVLHSVANQPVDYNTTVSDAMGSPVYALRLRVQCLG